MTTLQWTNSTSAVSRWGFFHHFHPYLSYFLCLLFLEIIPFFNKKFIPVLYFIYIYSFWIIISHFLCSFMTYLKQFWISDTEYDPSGNSKLTFHVGADKLNLLFLYKFLCFSLYSWFYKDFKKQYIYHSFLNLFYP